MNKKNTSDNIDMVPLQGLGVINPPLGARGNHYEL